MKIILACDHGGYPLKKEILPWLENTGYLFMDLGVNNETPIDYPILARKAAKMVAQEEGSRALLFCRSGIGMTIAANKVRGVYAINAHSTSEVIAARKDGDINVISLAAEKLNKEEAKSIITAFLETEFSEEERHLRRFGQIKTLEEY